MNKVDVKNNTKYRAYNFSLLLIRFIQEFPNNRIFWVFRDQLLRSGTSIGANIVEAQASATKKEFINYYHIAYKSCKETIYWLCLLRDSKLLDKTRIEKILEEATQIAKMISSSLITLKGRK